MGPTRSAPDASAPVLEVFASIQGEGHFVGEAQVFVRLRGCPLRCRWCDTPNSWRLDPEARARIATPGAARHEPCWATPFQAACWIAECEPGTPRTVSLTGGEPLVWPAFVAQLGSMLGGRRLHLETGGGHPRTLARVIDRVHHVSLDLKPDLDLDPAVEIVDPRATGERAPTTREEWIVARRDSLALVSGRDACGKIVISGARAAADFVPLLEEVADVAPGLRVYLQPATPIGGVPAPSLALIEDVCELARDREVDVRVVPQVHRALKMP